MESCYVTTVQDLMNYLHTLPKDMIVCGNDSGYDGLVVTVYTSDNCAIFSDNWNPEETK